MSAGGAGLIAIWAAIAFAVIAVLTGRRWAVISSSIAAVAATTVLGLALIVGDFSLAYVAETTSLATPWAYRLAALWGGMDGSMLFYTAMVGVLAAVGLSRPIPIRVAATISLGLLLITSFFANPFTVLDIPAVDGRGLLAILQHPAMVYHPPILYLGLTASIVPFALAIERALAGGDRLQWMTTVRRWMYGSWTLLTLGMAAGAGWAYVELGWGGFWAWDPVENTALMPWIAITVFLHTSRVEEASGRLRRWNLMFAGLPFALTVMGVYLTRSGATGSIHSFAEDPVVGRILLLSAALVAIVMAVLSARSELGQPWGTFQLDRDGWIAVNAVLLSVALVFLTTGSAYPAFVSVFRGDQAILDSRFFVTTILPIAVLVAASLAVALRRKWGWYPLVLLLAATAGAAIGGLHIGVVLLAPALASLLFLARGIVTNRPTRRRLTLYLAHLGMAVFLVGVAGSAFGSDFTGSMVSGESVVVAGHRIQLEDVETGETDRFVFVRADFDVDGSALSPEIRGYEDQDTPVAEPALKSGLVDDVVVAVSLLFPDASTVEVSVFVRPLVAWVWIGAGLMGVAGLLALLVRGGAAARQRRPATAGPRSTRKASETGVR